MQNSQLELRRAMQQSTHLDYEWFIVTLWYTPIQDENGLLYLCLKLQYITATKECELLCKEYAVIQPLARGQFRACVWQALFFVI